MDKLREAVLALIKDIESMSCEPDEGPDSGYWYGEFTEYEENVDGEVMVEWPNLSISVALVRDALAMTIGVAEEDDGGDNGGD